MSQEHREEITEINQDTNIFTLKLGDIIEIYAPKNDVLNEHTFFIEYINDIRMVLLNVATMEQIQLKNKTLKIKN